MQNYGPDFIAENNHDQEQLDKKHGRAKSKSQGKNAKGKKEADGKPNGDLGGEAHSVPIPEEGTFARTLWKFDNAFKAIADGSLQSDVPTIARKLTAVLLDEVEALLKRYMILHSDQVAVLSVYTLHCHIFELCAYTPYLHVTSPGPECGKSRLLDVLALVVARAWKIDNATAAVLRRKIDKARCSLLLDEVDGTFEGSSEAAAAITNVLNSGYCSEGKASLCERGGEGGFTVIEFSAFCPKVIAGLSTLPPTVISRSLPIRMERKKKSEKVTPFRGRIARKETESLREGLKYWSVLPPVRELADAMPEMPESLSDRQQDVCESLVAIADFAGPPWSRRLRDALEALLLVDVEDLTSEHFELMSNLRDVFCPEADAEGNTALRDELTTNELCAALNNNEAWRWQEYCRGDGINQYRLSGLLRSFRIRPDRLSRSNNNGRQLRGYQRTQFEEAWDRYLPARREEV
jgi:Protein of unknown function (DUF3631)